jgi:hypothetical protein
MVSFVLGSNEARRNEYEKYFLGSKSGWCVILKKCHLHSLSGSLNLLEPSGLELA